MKYLIASDLHGSFHYGQILVNAFFTEKADRLLLLGDILSGKDINKHDTAQLAALLNTVKDKILCVCGNCDSDSTQEWLEFEIMEDRRILYEKSKLIFATHGHLWNEANPPQLRQGDILLTGHTHIAKCVDHGSFIYINPGSISLPRGGSFNSYMLLENGIFSWKQADGTVYQTFSI